LRRSGLELDAHLAARIDELELDVGGAAAFARPGHRHVAHPALQRLRATDERHLQHRVLAPKGVAQEYCTLARWDPGEAAVPPVLRHGARLYQPASALGIGLCPATICRSGSVRRRRVERTAPSGLRGPLAAGRLVDVAVEVAPSFEADGQRRRTEAP